MRSPANPLPASASSGRAGEIRTRDLLNPIEGDDSLRRRRHGTEGSGTMRHGSPRSKQRSAFAGDRIAARSGTMRHEVFPPGYTVGYTECFARSATSPFCTMTGTSRRGSFGSAHGARCVRESLRRCLRTGSTSVFSTFAFLPSALRPLERVHALFLEPSV